MDTPTNVKIFEFCRHGEVYVTDDGGEMDLDLGNYERYLLTTLTRDHNITVSKPSTTNDWLPQ